MSLFLSRLSRLRLGKPALIRSSLILSNGFSSSLMQTPPCSIIGADALGANLGRLVISNANDEYFEDFTFLEEGCLWSWCIINDVCDYATVTLGASHGWVATLNKDGGILRLQDDLNPVASDKDPKRIPLPPLVTLPGCQTQIVTNVSMSSSSLEDEDCVVAVKFLGPQLSFCRPAGSNSEWTNVRIQNPCFFNSRVVFSKKGEMFRLLGSGGHLIGSWDLHTQKHTPMLQKLLFQNLPGLKKTKREILDSCFTSEHLVESQSTGETFLVKLYKKTEINYAGVAKMETEAFTVFKLDEEGNAVYTKDIGDLCIFLSNSEPFSVSASSFPGMESNYVYIFDFNERAYFYLPGSRSGRHFCTFSAPYHIPPQIIN